MDKNAILSILSEVYDPEIPVLSIIDLGILRDVKWIENQILVTITPTYSGCPATLTFEADILKALSDNGFNHVKVVSQISPAWTTAWMTDMGRKKLKAYGIAPPVEHTYDKNALFSDQKEVACPRCDSLDTKLLSQFGSTACKSLYQCNSCLEPFDYFKCH